MSYYLSIDPQIDYFKKALFSYSLAERHLKAPFADLLHNKASIHLYFQDYLKAIECFERAHKLDFSLKADAKVIDTKSIFNRVKKDFFDRFFGKSLMNKMKQSLLQYEMDKGASLQRGVTRFKNKDVSLNKQWKCKLISQQ